jgi:putative ABC transport system ATP-binding protein
MVTHDPVAASYADRVVFLADGQIVSELADPTPDTVLDTMKRLDVLAGDAAAPADDIAASAGAAR